MDVDAYLARIGASRADTLSALVDHHVAAVPFENLSIHLGETVTLDPAALYEKVVVRRRGGFCHELNGAFAWLLGELGHEVELLGARVAHEDGFTAPLSHVALHVTAGGRPWLVDVGFGRFGVRPRSLDPVGDGLRSAPDGDLDVLDDGGEVAYRVEPRARARTDFEPTCYWQTHSPACWFTHGPLCSLPSDGGRLTLTDHHLLRTAPDGSRTERDLGDGEALAAYRDLFGIDLDRLPQPLHPPG